MDNDWRLEWLDEHILRPWQERVRQRFEEARSPGRALHRFYQMFVGASSLLFSMAPISGRRP